ncbi:MAG: hypothetical protein AB7K36_30365 [Chloroflexota bacterium]
MAETERRRGRPKGTKNKPKPTAKEVAKGKFSTADEKISANLPALLDVMIERAVVDGDVACAKYLIDRVLGKATERQEISQEEQKVVIEIKDDWRS